MTRLSRGLRLWLLLIVVASFSVATFALFDPELYESTAYDAAREFLTIRGWGVVFAAKGLGALSALMTNNKTLTRIVLGLHVVVQFTFAWSILLLTFQEQYGAVAGSVQWITGALVSAYFLLHPLPVERGDGALRS